MHVVSARKPKLAQERWAQQWPDTPFLGGKSFGLHEAQRVYDVLKVDSATYGEQQAVDHNGFIKRMLPL